MTDYDDDNDVDDNDDDDDSGGDGMKKVRRLLPLWTEPNEVVCCELFNL